MVHGENRISYRIDRRLSGLAGPDYDATISFGLPIELGDCPYGKYRFSRNGQLVGVNTSILARDDSGVRIDGIGFAISVNMVKEYLPALGAGWFAIRDTTSIQSGKGMEFKINGVAGASIVYEFKVDTRSNSSLDIDFRDK